MATIYDGTDLSYDAAEQTDSPTPAPRRVTHVLRFTDNEMAPYIEASCSCGETFMGHTFTEVNESFYAHLATL